MKFLELENLSFFQIDHTSVCNLKCPQCARTSFEKNYTLPIGELSLDDYKNIFTPYLFSKIKKIKNVLFNGNYGDAVSSESLKPSLMHLKTQGIPSFTIMTNGSLRMPSWWADLATIMNRKADKVVFSIDGLKDTNSIYRINSNWDKIMENADAFISAGGSARWDFLVFDHNVHQIETAQKLAKKMGFKTFTIKKTNRFISDTNYVSGKSSLTNKIKNNSGDYVISAPLTNDKYISSSTKNFDNLINKHGSWSNYIDSTNIQCKYQKWGNGLFIDFEARLWPCTWLASPRYHLDKNNIQKQQVLQLFERYGADFNDLRKSSFEDVFNHKWFQSELVESWAHKQGEPNPKLMTCGRTCGEEYDFSSASENNRQFIQL